MLTKVTDDWTNGTHIYFRNLGKYPGETRKTNTYEVRPKQGDPIGIIKWYPAWRKYCFYPYADTLYEETCLRDIAEFIERETRFHKETQKREKAHAHTINT